MDLNFNSKLEEYYQKFIELQEKLKKSEEQRFMLEIKFNEMVHVAKEEEQSHYKKLRAQYKRFLEEDQKRQDRNERIIRNLERVETKISMLSAKTDRVNMFRRQYQNYLRRIANQSCERNIPDSNISRERSFIREEPLKEKQRTLFRDDCSMPERPKDIVDLETPIFKHPSVKKALEKDRSNEEKIEILDRYLQSMSSQRCRDVLNQEREAREKLSFDMPSDKFYKDDFTSGSTNHATAAADDIMNSIYSRYYTKGDGLPKGNNVELPTQAQYGRKEIFDENKSDYVNKDFRPDDKRYLDELFNKDGGRKIEQNKPTVSFKEANNILQVKNDADIKQQDDFRRVAEANPVVKTLYNQDQSDHSNSFKSTTNKLDNLKHAPENGNRQVVIEDNKKYTENIELLQKTNSSRNDENYLITGVARGEKVIQHVNGKDVENENNQLNKTKKIEEIDNNSLYKTEITNSDKINDDDYKSKNLEEDKETSNDSAFNVASPKIARSDDQSQQNTAKEEQLQKDIQLERVSQEQLSDYDSNNQLPTGKPEQFDSKEQPPQYNQQNEHEPYEQSGNQNHQNQDDQVTTESSQPIQKDPDSSPVLFDQNDEQPVAYEESGQAIQYDQNNQPLAYDQNQQEQSVQPILFTQDLSAVEYEQNSAEPVQYDETGQPIQYAENNQPYQQIQYDQSGQPIQYDENGQPIGYDQYGQPLLYDQNGQIVQPQYDENGQIIPQYDENGQMIILYDQHGQQYFGEQYKGDQQQFDANSQPIVQYDENGQPIYDQNQQPYYDYNNQEQADYHLNQYDQYQGADQGQYIGAGENQLNDYVQNVSDQNHLEGVDPHEVSDQVQYPDAQGNQQNDHTESAADQQHIEEDNEFHDKNDQGEEILSGLQDMTENNEHNNEIKSNEQTKFDERNDDGKGNEIEKPTNVMDILDTDTESAKQNTSKITNDSDFDFS